jgi:hypothetical protein
MTQGLVGIPGNAVPPEGAVGATAGAQIRQTQTFQYDPATNTYILVNTEVVALSDPATGMTIRPATAEQMNDLLCTMRALLRCETAVLNELSGRETSYDAEDFMNEEEGSD